LNLLRGLIGGSTGHDLARVAGSVGGAVACSEVQRKNNTPKWAPPNGATE
jgi:outer membrane lipoprotein SlyB